jgi:Asp-tRNA(Asn)/Glu-tRNA(Gln) amidotransferase A subunit family amidase
MKIQRFVLPSILILIMVFTVSSDEIFKPQRENVENAEKIIGLSFIDTERDSLLTDLQEFLASYMKIRERSVPNNVVPAIQFNPIPVKFNAPKVNSSFRMSPPDHITVPENINQLAFYSVRDLSELIRTRKITSVELTKFFIDRLKKYDPDLHCVISLTEDRALAEAREADQEIAAGKYRGPLHGIPYGAKDLLAVHGYPTTWGAVPYKNQVINEDATVIKRLEKAGAVLVAKLSLGALAWGDVWFGAKTRNPWNLEQGSSGSSAGSASATAAGLVPFAIGSETWGSIVSPSTRCGTTGLRPTYGRVSRAGAMALSWSMDKLGPLCRTVEDCAIVFNAIYGPDDRDQMVIDMPFSYQPEIDLSALKIGYMASAFDSLYDNSEQDIKTLETLRSLGVDLIPIELPECPVSSLSFILSAEAAAAFDELTRSNRDDLLVRQTRNAWPNVFRAARFIPAVEYIQANRVRYELIQDMYKLFKTIDLYVAPSFNEDNLLRTNLTGHPCVVLPNGFDAKGSPTSISFIGSLFDEGRLLAMAKIYQDATDYHRKHPSRFQ